MRVSAASAYTQALSNHQCNLDMDVIRVRLEQSRSVIPITVTSWSATKSTKSFWLPRHNSSSTCNIKLGWQTLAFGATSFLPIRDSMPACKLVRRFSKPVVVLDHLTQQSYGVAVFGLKMAWLSKICARRCNRVSSTFTFVLPNSPSTVRLNQRSNAS